MKVIEDILREVDLEVLRQAPHAQRKYNKITESLRLRFLTKIFKENKSIKKAAEELNINYSSAKTILTMHRKKSRSTNDLAGLGNNNNQLGQQNRDLQECTFPSPSVPRTLPPKHLMKPSFMSTASNLSEKQENEDSNSNEHIHNITSSHGIDAIKMNNNNSNTRTVFPCNSMHNLSNYSTNPVIRNYPRNNQSIPLSASSPNLQQLSNFALLQQIQNQNNTIPKNNTRNFLNPLPIIPQSVSCNNLLQLQQQTQLQQQQQSQNSLPSVLPAQSTTPSNQNILLQIQQQIQAQQQQQQMQNTLQQLLLLQSAILQQQAQQQLQQPIIEATNTGNTSNTNNPIAQLLLQQQLLMLNTKSNQTQQDSTLQLPASWI